MAKKVKALCVRVPRTEGETMRQALVAAGVLRTDCAIARDGTLLSLPVTEAARDAFANADFAFCDVDCKDSPPASYRDICAVPAPLNALLPHSFDIIGDIAVIKIPDELNDYAAAIGAALLEAHKNIAVVVRDRGVKSDFRVRDVTVIAGEQRTETVHRENALSLMVDVARTYYSPRLGAERQRVAARVADGDIILDMFAGVGPFALAAATAKMLKKVYAIDSNPVAVEYLRKNAALNDVAVLEAFCGDARAVIGREHFEKAQHIIMNLPHDAVDFFDVALTAAADGGTIHYYEIIDREAIDERRTHLARIAAAAGKTITLREQRIVRTYSPVHDHIVLRFTVSPL